MLFLNKPFFMSQFTPEDIVNIWTQGAHHCPKPEWPPDDAVHTIKKEGRKDNEVLIDRPEKY
jgi:hypothetical protein